MLVILLFIDIWSNIWINSIIIQVIDVCLCVVPLKMLYQEKFLVIFDLCSISDYYVVAFNLLMVIFKPSIKSSIVSILKSPLVFFHVELVLHAMSSPWRCVVMQMFEEGKASPSDTEPNVLRAGQGSLWDAGRDSIGGIDQLNINRNEGRGQIK